MCEKLVRLLLISTVLICPRLLISQVLTDVSIKNTTLVANQDFLPLWFHSNQQGKVEVANQYLNLTDFNINEQSLITEETNINWIWGTNLIAGLGNTSYYQVNQLFAGVTIKGWELKTGMFHDPIGYAGLSSTNGNLARSGNARSYPSIRFSNPRYKRIPFIDDWLKFKMEYDEGLLNDNRYVNNAHLHHKSLYFFVNPAASWDMEVGLEHFVTWGGESLDGEIGEFPTGFNEYLRYVFASSGSKDAPIPDQLNVAGNQIGTYQFKFTKRLPNINVSLYLSHLLESQIGLKWQNWQDNLIGLHLETNNENSFVTDVVYEVTNTRNQGVRDSVYIYDKGLKDWLQQFEDYFLHFLYKSGYTYHEKVMGSPLFLPVVQKSDGDGNTWYAIRSNRLFSHHLGVKGNLTNNVRWKGLLTYIKHLGTYRQPYNFAQKQVSVFFEINYIKSEFPFELGLSFAFDSGNTISNNLGVQFSVAKRW